MKQLQRFRRQDGKFTVAVIYEDYDTFDEDGLFPDINEYYRFATEEELINELNEENNICVFDIDTIYYGSENVTDNYLEFINDEGYRLLDKWHKNKNL